MAHEETSPVEADEITSQVEPSEEVDTQEPSAEDQFEEVTEETSEEPPVMYANKYASVEDLEKAYIHSNIEASRLAKELAELKKEKAMTPEERKQAQAHQEFIKANDVMTKSEFLQMQRDQKEASELISNGATQSQINEVMEISKLGQYSKMTITDIYQRLYGPAPKKKPLQGVRQKPSVKSKSTRPYTKAEINAMSAQELRDKYADILARGVA